MELNLENSKQLRDEISTMRSELDGLQIMIARVDNLLQQGARGDAMTAAHDTKQVLASVTSHWRKIHMQTISIPPYLQQGVKNPFNYGGAWFPENRW